VKILIEICIQPDLKNLYWVTSIKMDYNAYHVFQKTILIQNCLAIRADHSRIHACLLDMEIDDGCYNLISRTLRKIIIVKNDAFDSSDWPKIDLVFPPHRNYKNQSLKIKTWAGVMASILRSDLLDSEYINPLYVKDLVGDESEYYDRILYKRDPKKADPLIFRSLGYKRIAAIMPLVDEAANAYQDYYDSLIA
jgi:hypothetical protein